MAKLVPVRSYMDEVVRRLFEISRLDPNVKVKCRGTIESATRTYPLFCVTVQGSGCLDLYDRPKKYVLLSAGIHGEEPAGVYAILKFIQFASDPHDDYRFLIFPCINPFGFEHGYRFNSDGINVNRDFKSITDCQEARMVVKMLARRAGGFHFAVDLHETDPNFVGEGFTQDDNPDEFYMWEVCPDHSLRIGRQVIEAMERRFPVCKWSRIYKDKNTGGVIWYPEGCSNPVYAQGTTLEGYVSKHYTPQFFTLETPCGWSMSDRISAHLTALSTILFLKRSA